MRGLELCEAFYRTHGEPMLKEHFGHLMPYIAVALVGGGSECLGYDDDISRDHDFEPGFCILLPEEEKVSRREAFLLERAYERLPRRFMDVPRSRLSPVGGNRHGVLRMREFLEEHTGSPDGTLSLAAWCRVPEQSLLEVCAGRVFHDGLGAFTAARTELLHLPEDVRLKKLAGELVLMGQAGQYNFGRCAARADTAAARLCLVEFVRHALHAVFLINRTYMPYYKWRFRALSTLPRLSELAAPLTELLMCRDEQAGVHAVEYICTAILSALREEYRLPDGDATEPQGYALQRYIRDASLRNAHILFATD